MPIPTRRDSSPPAAGASEIAWHAGAGALEIGARMSPQFEETAAREIRDYVLHRLPLGVYDPAQTRRPRVAVASFTIELLEYDPETAIAHAAGSVALRTDDGAKEQFLRVSLAIAPDGRIEEGAEVRAAYIVETNPDSGACKETAALANA